MDETVSEDPEPDPPSPADTPTLWTLRFGLPFTGLWLSEDVRLLAGSAAVSVRFRSGIFFEVGLPAVVSECFEGVAPTARVGVSLLGQDDQDWQVMIPILATYSYGVTSGTSCEWPSDEPFRFLGGGLGIDVNYRAFNMRLLPVLGAYWRRDDQATVPLEAHESGGASLEIGYVFR